MAFSASNSAAHSVGRNGQVSFPSNVQINGVLTVGASDRFDLQADYSPMSTGAVNNQIIDIVAPSHRAYPPEIYALNGDIGGIAGETFEVWTIDIPGNAGYNAWPTAGYGNFPIVGETLPNFGLNNQSYTGRMGGTSSSCPEVAGVAALILSVNNNLTQQQVFDIITQTVERVGGYFYDANGWSAELGFGRINACAAVTRASPNNLTIDGIDPVCNSSTFSVLNLPATATVASWQTSNASIATVSASGVVTYVSNGTITFTANVAFPNRCGTIPVTRQIRIGGFTSSDYILTGGGSSTQPLYWCPNQTYSFFVNGSGYNYQWTIPSGWSINYQSNYLCAIKAPTSTSSPTGTVSVTFNEPCGTLITKSFFTAYSSSACTGTDPRFTYSPNPAPSYLYVAVASTYTSTTKIRSIQIIRTSTGVTVFDQNYGTPGVLSAYITTSSFQVGTYSLRIYDGSTWATYQFIR